MPIHKYPKHFYDPIRIEIAVSQLQHDFRKLLPSVSKNEWKNIDKDISEWFSGEEFELEPVHDFWNFFGGAARELKLKSMLFWITAENVTWKKDEVKTSEIVITWDFPGLEFMGKAPYRVKDVIAKLNQPEYKELLDSMRKDSDKRSKKYMPRDQFPVILFHDSRGGVIDNLRGHYILEGNRRVVRAIVRKEEKVSAYVGKFTSSDEKWPKNYWIRTGILRDLIFLAINSPNKYNYKVDSQVLPLLTQNFGFPFNFIPP